MALKKATAAIERESTTPVSVLVALLAAGLICHWPDLLNGGVFCDDRVFGYLNPPEYTVAQTTLGGHPWFGWWHRLLSFPLTPFKIYLSRFITFAAYLGTGFMVWKILARIALFDDAASLLAALVFISAPLAPAIRIYMTINQYAVCLFLWALGTYLAVFRAGRYWRISSLICLGLAFLTNSLLVFYTLTFTLIIVAEAERQGENGFAPLLRPALLGRIASRYPDFLLLPFLIFGAQNFFFPSGEYNKVHIEYVRNIGHVLPFFFRENIVYLVEMLCALLRAHWSNVVLLIILTSFWYFFFSRIKDESRNVKEHVRKATIFLLLAGTMFFLAIFPYYAVGKYPLFYAWQSRNQLLVPFTVCFLALCCFSCMKIAGLRAACFSAALMLSACTLLSLDFSLQYQRDWIKQLALQSHMQSDDAFSHNNGFLFCDDYAKNALSRQYGWYEYTSLFSEAAKGKSSFGMDIFQTPANDHALYDQPVFYERLIHPPHPPIASFAELATQVESSLAIEPYSPYSKPFVQTGDVVIVNISVSSPFMSSPSLAYNALNALRFALIRLAEPSSQKQFLYDFMHVATQIIPAKYMDNFIREFTTHSHSGILDLKAMCRPNDEHDSINISGLGL